MSYGPGINQEDVESIDIKSVPYKQRGTSTKVSRKANKLERRRKTQARRRQR